MERRVQHWTVETLVQRFAEINFPEFQREPNVWSLSQRQKLIDSMLREFDVASIYLYEDGDQMDCIDGRQRLNSIMCFLGKNPEHDHNAFRFRVINEIYNDVGHPYVSLEGKTFEELQEDPSGPASDLIAALNKYKLTIVLLSGIGEDREFNLQFTRLNLGTVINSGEKLHAMVGELRDVCFTQLGRHEFLESTRMPTRRYSREQAAAQILVQLFARHNEGKYARTRHFDLQSAFKRYSSLDQDKEALVAELMDRLTILNGAFTEVDVLLRNRAMTVSVVLLAMEQPSLDNELAVKLATFVKGFICRLRWQVKKGYDGDDAYKYLREFQRHLTQASVEKPAVEARASTLQRSFELWQEQGKFEGDDRYRAESGGNPETECVEA